MFTCRSPDAWPACFLEAFVRLGLGLAGLADADGEAGFSSVRYQAGQKT